VYQSGLWPESIHITKWLWRRASAPKFTVAKYDTNSDGVITSEELLAVNQAAAAAEVAELLAAYDLNGDGEITSAEIATVQATRHHSQHGR